MSLAEKFSIPPEQIAVLNEHLKECPVKLGKLCKGLGVGVRVARLERGISGQIRRDQESDRYVICVNRYEARERQRFTIAHELAHFLLHKEIIDKSPDGIQDNVLYRSGHSNTIEVEANRLAAEIVMPVELIRDKVQGFGKEISEIVIEQMAEEFEVSTASMEIRLQSIHLT